MGRATGVLATMVALWAATSCLDITSNVPQIGAITPVILPFPSVVTGESLFDTTGKAASIQVMAFGTNGKPIPPQDLIVRFYAVDSTGKLKVDSLSGKAFGDSLSPSAAVVVSVRQANGVGGFVQTPTTALPVVPVPISASRSPDTSTTFDYNVLVTDTLSSGLLSPPLTVTVQAQDTVVQKYLVTYQIVSRPAPASSGVGPTLVLRGNGADSTVAVTNAAGQASLQLQVRPSALSESLHAAGATFTAIVVATVIKFGGDTLKMTPDDSFVVVFKSVPILR
jgi:hypothetical protein